jgi:hypothetical protein
MPPLGRRWRCFAATTTATGSRPGARRAPCRVGVSRRARSSGSLSRRAASTSTRGRRRVHATASAPMVHVQPAALAAAVEHVDVDPSGSATSSTRDPAGRAADRRRRAVLAGLQAADDRPRVNVIVAATFMAAAGDIRRFGDRRRLTAYSGSIPRSAPSDESACPACVLPKAPVPVDRTLEPPEAYFERGHAKEPMPADRRAMARCVAVCRGVPRRVELTPRPTAGRPCGRPATSGVPAGCRW